MTTSPLLLSDLHRRLAIIQETGLQEKAFIGFDGFVDKIKKAVKQKQHLYTAYFNSLHDFADRIAAATGKSGQIEMDTVRTKLGGNAPILANALGKLGIQNFCMGSMGFPERHPVFDDMNRNCEVINILPPGLSDAIEFTDGKIIFSELNVFDHYDWQYIIRTAGKERLQQAIGNCTMISFVDWVNLPHAIDLWRGFLLDIIKPSARKDFLFLFDLCDPSKKSAEQIKEALDVIGYFSHYGKVTLGLNENETFKLWAAINHVNLDDPATSKKMPAIIEAAATIFKFMNIDTLLVHPVDRTIVFVGQEILELPGRVVTKPKVLTGGGDNLNAGYCLGLMYGLPMPQCMLLGMAASGAYIENGVSPTIQDLIEYLKIWGAQLENETRDKSAPVTNFQNQL